MKRYIVAMSQLVAAYLGLCVMMRARADQDEWIGLGMILVSAPLAIINATYFVQDFGKRKYD
jgi:hypothetical protein